MQACDGRPDRIELEADPRHVELTVRDLKLEHAKVSSVPGAKDVKGKKVDDCEEENKQSSPGRRPPTPLTSQGGKAKLECNSFGPDGRGGEWHDDEFAVAEESEPVGGE